MKVENFPVSEKLSLAEIINKADPQTKPLLEAVLAFATSCRDPIEMSLWHNGRVGATKFDWDSEAAKALALALWKAKAPPGGSHAAAAIKVFHPDFVDETGYAVAVRKFKPNKSGWERRKLRAVRMPDDILERRRAKTAASTKPPSSL